MSIKKSFPWISLSIALSSLSFAQEKLVIVGGGARPAGALQQFATWAGEPDPNASISTDRKVLIIAWATESPQEYVDAFMEDFSPFYSGPTDNALNPPKTTEEQYYFLNQLRNSTGVFFTGGDQSRVMDTFENENGDLLLKAIHAAYANGVVFGGTSAGTAIMSQTMITGDMIAGVTPLRPGLGFLDPIIIVDQHFSQRRRKRRLISALNATQKPIGIGIDEATALLVTDKENFEVTGENNVKVYVRQGQSKRFDEHIFEEGGKFRIPQSSPENLIPN